VQVDVVSVGWVDGSAQERNENLWRKRSKMQKSIVYLATLPTTLFSFAATTMHLK
jgi:hypothetical protein